MVSTKLLNRLICARSFYPVYDVIKCLILDPDPTIHTWAISFSSVWIPDAAMLASRVGYRRTPPFRWQGSNDGNVPKSVVPQNPRNTNEDAIEIVPLPLQRPRLAGTHDVTPPTAPEFLNDPRTRCFHLGSIISVQLWNLPPPEHGANVRTAPSPSE